MSFEQQFSLAGSGYWLGKYGTKKDVHILPDKYLLFEDRFGRKIPYSIHWNTNHAIFICGISRWGKTYTTNQICKAESKRGAKIIYDNYKGESLPFKTYRIDAKDVQFDIKTLKRNDWQNMEIIDLTSFPSGSLSSLRRLIKEMDISGDKIELQVIEDAVEQSRRMTKNTKDSIYNVLEDLDESNMLSTIGINILELVKKHKVIEIDCSQNPPMRMVVIPYISRIIVEAKMTGIIPKDEKLIMVYDEIADPEHGVGPNKGKRSVASSVKAVFTKGGVYNLNGIANTQLPQDTSSQIIGNCTDKIIHRVIDKNAIDRIANVTGIEMGVLRNILPKLDKGECLFIRGKTQEMRRVLTIKD